jgi:hypothetical protein
VFAGLAPECALSRSIAFRFREVRPRIQQRICALAAPGARTLMRHLPSFLRRGTALARLVAHAIAVFEVATSVSSVDRCCSGRAGPTTRRQQHQGRACHAGAGSSARTRTTHHRSCLALQTIGRAGGAGGHAADSRDSLRSLPLRAATSPGHFQVGAGRARLHSAASSSTACRCFCARYPIPHASYHWPACPSGAQTARATLPSGIAGRTH